MIIRSNIVCLLYSLGHDCLNFAFVEQRLESCFAFIKVSLLCLLPLYVSARSEIQKRHSQDWNRRRKYVSLTTFHSKATTNLLLHHKNWFCLGVLSLLLKHWYVLLKLKGHSWKIGNIRCPGTLKNQNPQFEEKK